ncbi:MAG: hypothetical protein HYV63_00090 [Candidatus Schekmanbacteria bacterium]|nr:hypothetical protein [Candidatus Schekmanbacteria bacterium]
MSAHGVTRRLAQADVSIPSTSSWSKLPLIGGGLAAAGAAGSAAFGLADHGQLFFSYLVAFLFFVSIAIGGLFFVLVNHLSRAGWGVVVRRLAENLMGTLPLFLLLFVPIAFGLHDLYHWAHHEAVAGDPVLAGKAVYLNPTFFLIRGFAFLVLWSAAGLWFLRTSVAQDSSGEPCLTRRMQMASAPMTLLFAVTVTLAAFDWIMSLEPHWFSTVFGVYFFSGCVVAVYATMILLVLALDRSRLLGNAVSIEHVHDLGKMLFAFVAFWAYIAFSQFMLIWYANLPEETIWYSQRWDNSWRGISIFLAVGHFIVPFFFLLSRAIKRNRTLLACGAAWMLFIHLVDVHWLVMPTHHREGFHFSLMDPAAILFVGGLFLVVLGLGLKKQALVPLKDPRLSESLAFENF